MPVKSSDPGLLFVGSFWIRDSILVLVISLFLFSIAGLVLGNYIFLRIFKILLGCPCYCYIVARSSLLWSFVFLWCWLYLLLFGFSSYWFWPPPFFFFLMSLAKVCQFSLSFWRLSIDLFYCFLSLYFIHFCSDLWVLYFY